MIFRGHYSEETTLALAGIVQSVLLVDELAKTGHAQENQIEACFRALLCQKPVTFLEVFGAISLFEKGLRSIPQFFSLRNSPNQLSMRYMVQIVHLQKVFLSRSDMVQAVASEIGNVSGALEQTEGAIGDVYYSDISRLYQNTISTLNFRIQVHGSHTHLNQASVANRIRTMLFSAIRFSLLWHQVGGRRLDFVFAKKAIIAQSRNLLESQ